MAEHVPAYDTRTGEKTLVHRRWVDNPAIQGGRYVSSQPSPKTSRSKREPVETKAADRAATNTDTPPTDGASTKETS